MDLISSLYTPRTWTHYSIDPFDAAQEANQPQLDAAPVSAITSTSQSYNSTNNALGRLGADIQAKGVAALVVWDYELTAAGFPELASAGGTVNLLAQDWNGHRVGAMVMVAYRKVNREGKLPKVVFETFIAS